MANYKELVLEKTNTTIFFFKTDETSLETNHTVHNSATRKYRIKAGK